MDPVTTATFPLSFWLITDDVDMFRVREDRLRRDARKPLWNIFSR